MKHSERVAREGKTKIKETQAAECVTFLAELSGLRETAVLNLIINDKPLCVWLAQENLRVGRIEKLAQILKYDPYS